MITQTNSRELKVGEFHITIREMTVSQVRNLLQDAVISFEQPASDMASYLINNWLIQDASLSDLKRMSTLTDEQINALHPSDLRKIAETCKELNPDFFGLLARLTAASQATK